MNEGHRLRKVPKILVIGPGRNVRGGITAVISMYSQAEMWKKYSCYWLESYDDRGQLAKIWAALRALSIAPVKMIDKEIVHIHTSHCTSFFRKSLFFFMAKLFRKKVIIHIHASNDNALFSRWLPPFFISFVLESAEKVIVLSPFLREKLIAKCSKANIQVITNPCTCVVTYDSMKIDEQLTVLYAGRLDEKKGFLDLIEAMALVIGKYPYVTLLMAGDGDILRGQALVRKLGIESSVRFPGWITGEEKEQAFLKASIFCLPSYDEGMPMAMLEAMGHGLPVVVTPVGGIPDVIKDGVNGLFVTPGDPDSIASAIIKLLSGSELRRTLRINAWETVANKFSVTGVNDQLSALYDELMQTL